MRLPALLLKRRAQTHKGDYGHLLVMAGSLKYAGAAYLAAAAALRSGAGAVTLAVPDVLYPILAVRCPEVMVWALPATRSGCFSHKAQKDILGFLNEKADAFLLGCGIGRDVSTQRLVRGIVKEMPSVPVVADADALFALQGQMRVFRKKGERCVLTPHPKEFNHLSGCKPVTGTEERKKVAINFSIRYNINLILKGNRSVVTSSAGRAWVNRTGNPGMATAGSGDVLAGIVGALLAQGLPVFEAARTAVYLHGLAGDLAAEKKTQTGLIASDLIDFLPLSLKKAGAA